jgi:DNA segregation ATPase FtsK/SpoIIIE, S-DNA-T family
MEWLKKQWTFRCAFSIVHDMGKEKKNGRGISPFTKGCIFLACAIFLGLSLISYDDSDPRRNWLGLLGHVVGWSFTYLFGLASWLLPIFLGWLGWKFLTKKEIEALPPKLLYFATTLFSLSILLAMTAQTSPSLTSCVQRWIYSDYYPRKASYDPSCLRHYLGGVPLHHLYVDTSFNIRNLLGAIGTLLLFLPLFLFSSGLLINFPFRVAVAKLQRLMNQKIPLPSAPLPVRKRPFQTEEGEESEKGEIPPPLVREDPLKRVTRIKIPEGKPPSNKQAPLSKGSVKGEYLLPPPSLLTEVPSVDQSSLKSDLKRQAKVLEETLLSFGIEAKVGDIHCGPTITSFEVHPAVGVKVQKIKTLENDIALNLQAKSIRIIAPIPGKAAVGIEVPNPSPQEVSFRDLLESYLRQRKNAHIPLLLGKIVNGDDMWTDLTKMPHLIIAGATGSGKSVCINTLVMSIVMNARPDEIKLVMIDPKKVELTAYTHLPHMLAPVITEPGGACAALAWLVKEMERRYEIFRQLGIRNIHGFNTRKANKELEESLELAIPAKMPFIVVIIDELADLMMISSSDIETPIARIAQMARAVGIHMIVATQRPSREVITGLIKANFPCRIAFKVSSRVNSQIIIDETGAETLLGNGDMLFMPPGTSTLCRAQGAFIRDDDINNVIHFCCSQAATEYTIPSFESYREHTEELESEGGARDPLFEEAKKLVLETGNASTTFLQRKMKLGYARAASLMDLLEQKGIIGPSEGAKPRKIYYPNRHEEEENK